MLLLFALLFSGCGHHTNTVTQGKGEAVAVIVEPGLTASMDSTAQGQYHQVADFMREDLVNRLQRHGYQVEVLRQRKSYTPSSGQHLLAVEIERYNPGSKAARILVGFGAGATSVDIAYTIVHEDGRTLISSTDGVGSSRDWHFCCRALNERLVEALALELADA